MIQSLYNGLTGVTTHQFGVDVVSNNIANVNTNGYRADVTSFQSLFSNAVATMNANSPISNTTSYGVTVASNTFSKTIGSFVNADNTSALALSGEGWFVVGNKDGTQQYYTRDGNFTKDSEGYLVNQNGMYVLGYDLGKVENNTFTSDLSENQIDTMKALSASDGTLQALQIVDDTFFQPTATTSVDTRINLNKDQNIKPIDEAFMASIYGGEIDQIAQRDLSQFYDIKDGSTLSIKLLDYDGNMMTDANGNTQEAVLTYKSGLEYADTENRAFSTIAQLQDIINLDANNNSVEFVLSIEDGNFQFKNISGEQFIMDFSDSSVELLSAFALPQDIKMTSLGDTVKTAPLYQKNFYEQDMNTLHNDTLAPVDIKTNDDFSVRVNGSLVKDKILYTHERSDDPIEIYETSGEFLVVGSSLIDSAGNVYDSNTQEATGETWEIDENGYIVNPNTKQLIDFTNAQEVKTTTETKDGYFNTIGEFVTGLEDLLREKDYYLKDENSKLVNIETGDFKDEEPINTYSKDGTYLDVDGVYVTNKGIVVDAETKEETGEQWDIDADSGFLISPTTGNLIDYATGIERDPTVSYIKNIDGTLSIPGTENKLNPYTMTLITTTETETIDENGDPLITKNTVEEDATDTYTMEEVQGDLRVRVYMQDCRIKLENITDERIEIDFSSANLDFVKSLGLSSSITLDPEGATQTSKMYVPTYSTSNEVYDLAGKKYFLNTSYVLKSQQELGTGEDVWDMYSMIYSLENDSLVSDNYTLGQLRFEDVNTSPSLYSVDIDGETGNKVYTEKIRSTKDDIYESLEVNFNVNANADTILFNPTGTEEGISTGASYMDSVIRDSDIDGNAEGYLSTMVVDLNGVINYYFSNEKAEAFGRVAVVDFVNEQGLQKVSGNLFSATSNSGERNFLWGDEVIDQWKAALENPNITDEEKAILELRIDEYSKNAVSLEGTTVMQNKLETSNVDMNQALTSLIVMQRGYSSSAKSITTADEMLKKAIEMKR
jgi:flagellar hook-basal body protein